MWFRYLGSGALFFVLFLSFGNVVLANEGDLDLSFGTGGKSSADITGQLLDDAVGDIALLPDGRILVAGTTSSGFPSEHDLAAVVFNPDGSLDESFGRLGRVLIDQGGNEFCYALAVQSDGRILLGGYRTVLAGGSPESLVLRLNPDGGIDSTFGTQGAFEPALPFAVVALAIIHDGFVIAAGSRPSPSGSDFAIARLTNGGRLDESFGQGGVVFLDFGSDDFLTGLSVDPNGRLLVVGMNTAGALELARLLANGSADLTFNGSGKRVIDLGCSYDVSAAIQPDQKILVGTTIGPDGLSDFLLTRLKPDGTSDLDFGTDGVVTGDLTGTDDYLTCVTLQPDGKILAVGWAGFYPDFLVQRYHPDGSVDKGFGLDGWIHTDFIGDEDRARVAVVQPDGRFILAGDVPGSDADESRDFGLARYEITGAQQSTAPRVTSRSVRSGSRARSDSPGR
ncbi:MAG: hypothetical protein EHM23_22390 [Acidobacteria bacterium]|nr:MAG: hypothetical protein EHM23_22390 [Acidobacteriota bacterium]